MLRYYLRLFTYYGIRAIMMIRGDSLHDRLPLNVWRYPSVTRRRPKAQSLPVQRRLLTAREVSAKLAIGLTRTYGMLNSGELPVVRIGDRTVRCPEEELDAWLASRLQGGVPR